MNLVQIIYAAWRDADHVTRVSTYSPGIKVIGRQYERDIMATATSPLLNRAPTEYEQRSLALPASAVVVVARAPVLACDTTVDLKHQRPTGLADGR